LFTKQFRIEESDVNELKEKLKYAYDEFHNQLEYYSKL